MQWKISVFGKCPAKFENLNKFLGPYDPHRGDGFWGQLKKFERKMFRRVPKGGRRFHLTPSASFFPQATSTHEESRGAEGGGGKGGESNHLWIGVWGVVGGNPPPPLPPSGAFSGSRKTPETTKELNLGSGHAHRASSTPGGRACRAGSMEGGPSGGERGQAGGVCGKACVGDERGGAGGWGWVDGSPMSRSVKCRD